MSQQGDGIIFVFRQLFNEKDADPGDIEKILKKLEGAEGVTVIEKGNDPVVAYAGSVQEFSKLLGELPKGVYFEQNERYGLLHDSKENSIEELSSDVRQASIHLKPFKVRYDRKIHHSQNGEIPATLHLKLQAACKEIAYGAHNPIRNYLGVTIPESAIDSVRKIEGVTEVVPEFQYDIDGAS